MRCRSGLVVPAVGVDVARLGDYDLKRPDAVARIAVEALAVILWIVQVISCERRQCVCW